MNKGLPQIFKIGDCIERECCFSDYKFTTPEGDNYKLITQKDGGIEISVTPDIKGNTVSFGKLIRGKYEGYLCYGSSLAVNRDRERDGRVLPRIDLDKMIPLQAVFSLRIGSKCRENEILIAIDVIDVQDPSNRIGLNMRNLTRADFQSTDTLQLFRLDFTPLSSDTILEFRILYCGKEYKNIDIQKYRDKKDVICADKIIVIDPAKAQFDIPYEIIEKLEAPKKLINTANDPMKNGFFILPSECKLYQPNTPLRVMVGIFKSNSFDDNKKPILCLTVNEKDNPAMLSHKEIFHSDFSIEKGGNTYFTLVTLDFETPNKETKLQFRLQYLEKGIWNPEIKEAYYIKVGKMLVLNRNNTMGVRSPQPEDVPWWAIWLIGWWW